MLSRADQTKALVDKIKTRIDDALRPIEREMIIMKWPFEFRVIIWDAVAEEAERRAVNARTSAPKTAEL